MSLANILLTAVAALGAIFVLLFFRLIRGLQPDQRKLLAESKPGKIVNVLTAAPVLLLVFGPPQYRVIAAGAFIVGILIMTWVQHRWLLTHGAKRELTNRLLLLSAASLLALTAFSGSMILES